jgi:hypothetical protein
MCNIYIFGGINIMTIKNSWGKMICAVGFAGAAVCSFLRYVCYAIFRGAYTSFWYSCASLFAQLIPFFLLAAAAGYGLIYLATKDNFDLIVTAGIAGCAVLFLFVNSFGSIAWVVLSGICLTACLAVFALRAKDENKMIMVALLACAALYAILGNVILFKAFRVSTFSYILAAFGYFATFVIPALFVYTTESINVTDAPTEEPAPQPSYDYTPSEFTDSDSDSSDDE